MAVNRGKKFEDVIEKAFSNLLDVSIVRLHDQTTGYLGSSNHCDFIVYKKPYEYHIECKSVHGNTLSIYSIPKPDKNGVLHGFYGNITDKQWEGLLEKSKIKGVVAGIICWWIDKDLTYFIPIQLLEWAYTEGFKSVPSKFYELWKWKENNLPEPIKIQGFKKRIFFDYDMEDFLRRCPNEI